MKMLKKTPKLSDEEYGQLLQDIEDFESKFYVSLIGTDRYEVIPTTLEDGDSLNKEQYALIKAECAKLGLKVIYQIEMRDGTTIYINPENLKVGYIHDGIH